MLDLSPLTFLLLLILSTSVLAKEPREPFFDFASTNIQTLWGDHYELGPRTQKIVTIEHAHRGAYGDFFGFVDASFANDVGVYAELAPRFKLEHLGVPKFDTRYAKNLYFAGTLELGKRGLRRTLYGVGTDLIVPGFKFVKFNVFQRDDPRLSGKTQQATIIWAARFRFANMPLVFEGFADFTGREGRAASHRLLVPRLLLDLAALRGSADSKVFVGIEYQHWRNKYGRRGVTESVAQFQLKVLL